MEKYKYETKYNIKDKVFVIKHNKINDFMNRRIESYEIYNTEIKEIRFNAFGVIYSVEDIREDFKEENVFLQTDEKGLFGRLSTIMKKKM